MKQLQSPELNGAYLWQPMPDGSYVDRDGFVEINILAVEDDMASEVVATVLYAGTAVLEVRSSALAQPTYALVSTGQDHAHSSTQSLIAFLTFIGEASEDLAEAALDDPELDIYESDLMGDGHELVGFVGLVAGAVHAAWPEDTAEPVGF